jgi:hypothetical protein
VIVPQQHPEILQWAANRLQCDFGRDAVTVANLNSRGEITCVVVFHAPRNSGCEVSIASERGLNNGFMKFVFGYAFQLCRFRRLTALVSTENQESSRLVEKIGFKQEGTLRKAADDGTDLHIYGLLKEECRWVRNQEAGRKCRPPRNTSH